MNYKKMSSESLKKEIFLLEHGFYDEEVTDFVSKNMTLFFSENSAEYFAGVKLERDKGSTNVCLLPERKRTVDGMTIKIPYNGFRDIMVELPSIHQARMIWFKKKFNVAVKE